MRFDTIASLDARDLFRVCKCEVARFTILAERALSYRSNPRERSLATRRVKSLGAFPRACS